MADTEHIACRILVGDAGQRFQGFLTRLGLDHSYVGFDAFPYMALRAAALARICRCSGAHMMIGRGGKEQSQETDGGQR